MPSGQGRRKGEGARGYALEVAALLLHPSSAFLGSQVQGKEGREQAAWTWQVNWN